MDFFYKHQEAKSKKYTRSLRSEGQLFIADAARALWTSEPERMITVQTCVHRKGGSVTTEVVGLATIHLHEAAAGIEKLTRCSTRVVQSSKLLVKGDVGDMVADWLLRTQVWKLESVWRVDGNGSRRAAVAIGECDAGPAKSAAVKALVKRALKAVLLRAREADKEIARHARKQAHARQQTRGEEAAQMRAIAAECAGEEARQREARRRERDEDYATEQTAVVELLGALGLSEMDFERLQAVESRAAEVLQRERQIVDQQRDQAREAQAQHNLLTAETEAAKVRAPEFSVPVFYGGKIHQKMIDNSFNKQNGRNKAACSSQEGRAFGSVDGRSVKLTAASLRKLPSELWTTRESGSSRHASQASAVSISTAQWTAILPRHIKGRMFTRDIDKGELQRARKHGERVPLSGGKLAWLHEGLTYITDATGRIGVTTWKEHAASARAAPVGEERAEDGTPATLS